MNNIFLNNSSQPYLYLLNNTEQLLYCFADTTIDLFFGSTYSIRPWKIRRKDMSNNTDFEVQTPTSHPQYGDIILECNPHLFIKDSIVYLNYVAGFSKGPNTPIEYYLCSIQFSDLTLQTRLNSEFIVMNKTFAGFYYENTALYSTLNKFDCQLIKETIDTGAKTTISFNTSGFINLLRITKIYNDNMFILTAQKNNNTTGSFILDSNFNIVKEIFNSNNEPVYKCTLLNNNLIYTIKDAASSEIEKRHLVQETYTL